ncbi:Bug family tripartite tricarboxylate transporter substrate binding protein [Limnohabitans sp. 63ED37-2]|uniref:Bug family tripartite tricarboxylate transporter substrate binding protein n=1 Tax=Limnohabitans sp. 63ED37-2 TaxID=1678128 RepID=UPI0007063538|nr:tripartite tricarboxylate transporter substrate binding protein [Limnohabitans sp. 63ED37-2]ALK88327.1 Tripartite tricarboxylate transporter family receptor [Limnohabitans sp. 63ED37-2]
MKLKKILLTALLATPLLGLAQSYPNKPVRIMVGANAGGGTDIIARMLAEKMGEAFKGSFVVENKPGASNTIAADLTAKAPADGHTLLVATNTGQAIAPHLIKLSFDPIKDLTPVGLIVTVPNVLVVGANVPANNVAELVSLMKAKPNEFKYASSGVGSTQHIAGEGFNLAAGVKSIHVPYRGSSQAHLDIIGGNVQIMFDTTSSAMGQIKAGKFKPLALTTATRSAELPQVPTLAEAGVSGFEMSTWYGMFVTTGTPPEVTQRLQTELAKILKMPDIQAKLKGLGGEPGNITPDQFAQMNRQEFTRFGDLIKKANIKLE